MRAREWVSAPERIKPSSSKKAPPGIEGREKWRNDEKEKLENQCVMEKTKMMFKYCRCRRCLSSSSSVCRGPNGRIKKRIKPQGFRRRKRKDERERERETCVWVCVRGYKKRSGALERGVKVRKASAYLARDTSRCYGSKLEGPLLSPLPTRPSLNRNSSHIHLDRSSTRSIVFIYYFTMRLYVSHSELIGFFVFIFSFISSGLNCS